MGIELRRVGAAIDDWARGEKLEAHIRQVQLAADQVIVLATLISDEAGAEALLSISPDGKVSIIEMDSHLMLETHVRSLDKLGAIAAGSCGMDPRKVPGVPEDPKIPVGLNAAERIAFVAHAFQDKLLSGSAPCTDGGNLACAWAVNHVVNVATGTPIGAVAPMLATKTMFQRLSAGPAQKIDLALAGAGDIVISPTNGRIGHVGILIDGVRICSNGSKAKAWKQNYTKGSWIDSYHNDKKLLVWAFHFL